MLAADVKAKSAPKVIQADAAINAKQASDDTAGHKEVMRPVINAAGATKDVHEADLDLTHADSAPGTLLVSAWMYVHCFSLFGSNWSTVQGYTAIASILLHVLLRLERWCVRERRLLGRMWSTCMAEGPSGAHCFLQLQVVL